MILVHVVVVRSIKSVVENFFNKKNCGVTDYNGKNMNTKIFDYLNTYATISDPQYAIMLRGRWGCGKTHFIKGWLNKFEEKAKQPADENSIELKPIYVSLFGMSALKDVKVAIDKCVNPFFYSKTGKILKTAWRVASRIAFKTEIDLDNNGSKETSFSGTLDALSVFEERNDKEIKGVKFIIFDDIERCLIPMKQLLGFINYFVEQCNCHVVIIGEEKYLDEDSQKELQEFKEKVIGRDFEIHPDVDEAIRTFIEHPMMDTEFLQSEFSTIKECFECTQNNNLRLLRQSLLDYSLLLATLPDDLKKDNHEYLKALLSSYIAVYAEFRNRENHHLFNDWSNMYSSAMFGLKGDEAERAMALVRKYQKVDDGNEFEALSPDIVSRIVSNIDTGEDFSVYICQILNRKGKKVTALESLGNYWDKSNEEFDDCSNRLIEEVLKGDIYEPAEVGKSIALLGYFDLMKLRKFPLENMGDFIERVSALLKSCGDLQELYKCKNQFFQGYNFVRNHGEEQLVTTDIIKCFNEVFKQLQDSLPNEMQVVLRNLSDSNVDKLIMIDNESYPDHSSTYRMRSIFAKEDTSTLCDFLCKMSNKGRNEFCQFLDYHYDFHSICGFADRYKPDFEVVSALKAKLEEVAKTKVSIERWSYDNLIDNLNKAVIRCRGEQNVSM